MEECCGLATNKTGMKWNYSMRLTTLVAGEGHFQGPPCQLDAFSFALTEPWKQFHGAAAVCMAAWKPLESQSSSGSSTTIEPHTFIGTFRKIFTAYMQPTQRLPDASLGRRLGTV